MYIILGATGHVGSTAVLTLLDKGEPVTVITHDSNKADEWQQKGARVAIADVLDSDQLRSIFRQGQRLFVLNPPAAPSSDTAREERKSVASILAALTDSGIQKIVAESTYDAQPGDRIGDLGVLYELEQGLVQTGIPTSIIRAAYYMSNWDMSLATARQEGKVHTLYPPDLKLPMAAPQDLGQEAARLLQEPIYQTGLHYVEGPEAYSSADVAAAFATALDKPVEAVQTPQDQWLSALKTLGFSQPAAESMAAMTALTIEQVEKRHNLPDSPVRGKTTLQEYVNQLVKNNS